VIFSPRFGEEFITTYGAFTRIPKLMFFLAWAFFCIRPLKKLKTFNSAYGSTSPPQMETVAYTVRPGLVEGLN
jgi:hypothetical protein